MIKTNNLSIVKINDLEYRLSGNMVYIILGLKPQEVYYDVELNYFSNNKDWTYIKYDCLNQFGFGDIKIWFPKEQGFDIINSAFHIKYSENSYINAFMNLFNTHVKSNSYFQILKESEIYNGIIDKSTTSFEIILEGYGFNNSMYLDMPLHYTLQFNMEDLRIGNFYFIKTNNAAFKDFKTHKEIKEHHKQKLLLNIFKQKVKKIIKYATN